MTKLSNDQNNALIMAKNVNTLSEPLFKNSDIKHFNLVREYYDGRRTSICSRADWLENHNQKKYHLDNLKKYKTLYTMEFVIADHLPQDEMLLDANNNFNIAHGFSIHAIRRNYIEFYHFATAPGRPEINNWYINNIPILKKFIMYFLDSGRELIEGTTPVPFEDNSFDISKENLLLSKNAPPNCEIEINRWFPRRQDGSSWLNHREIQVMKRVLLGKTSKVIAKELSISPRTVEFHINNLKSKFECNNKMQLLQKVTETSFIGDFMGY